MQSKLGTYLNFCKRAGKLVLGVNAAKSIRGRVWLFVADVSASDNTKKEIEKLSKKFSCTVLWVYDLDVLVHKEKCKLAAVAQEQLARAILQECKAEKQENLGTAGRAPAKSEEICHTKTLKS